jgi:putative tricarboxylic transport membrane protein
LDVNLRRGLALSDGDVSPFFSRPISAFICSLIVLSILLSIPAIQRLASAILAGLLPRRSRPDGETG